MKKITRTFCEKIKEYFKKIPCYLMTVAFRTASFALTITYLREISIGTNLILVIALGIMSYKRVHGRTNGEDKFSDAANYSFTNFGVMSVHGFGLDTEENDDGKKRQEEEEPKAIAKFIRNSNLFSFFHHAIILVIVMLISYYEIWEHAEFFEYLKNDQLLFNLILYRCYIAFT